MKYPFYKQLNEKDCGPTCFRMISKYYGKDIDSVEAKRLCNLNRNGTTLFTISKAAESIGYTTLCLKISWRELSEKLNSPCIIYWNKSHFVVLWQIDGDRVYIGDPAIGNISYCIDDFLNGYIFSSNHENQKLGVALLLEPSDKFNTCAIKSNVSASPNSYFKFIKPHKRLLYQLIVSFLLSSLISFVLPFLAQGIVDIGISTKDKNIVFCIIIGQISLIIGMCVNQFISGWLMAHISNRVSITMVCHFLEKLMKLRVSFFDVKMIGDLLSRIQDFNRIEHFLTSALIGLMISFVGLIVYGIVLFQYSWKLLIIFTNGAVIYLVWIYTFKNRRRILDYKRFLQVSQNQSLIIHLIRGMQDIKLNNCERYKLNSWHNKQMQIYNVNIQSVKLMQFQNVGALMIDQIKNILITYFCANSVINGSFTIGMMVAVNYVLGQLNGPLYQLSSFIQLLHDAQISMERINEVNMEDDEELLYKSKKTGVNDGTPIVFRHVTFRYAGSIRSNVLTDISCVIKPYETPAIVGESGSGKSTFLKLILGFYNSTEGHLYLGNTKYEDIDLRDWRKKCSVVMQDGYLFTETIAENIALSTEQIDYEKVEEAAKLAKIHQFIDKLPLGYNTIIGEDGLNLSGGQKQRLCIARAIYKNGSYVILDEATNALDANNENDILDNLSHFYKNRTVIIVAHRLSTIKHADNIIVLKDGRIIETGNHNSLIKANSFYAKLFAKQMNS